MSFRDHGATIHCADGVVLMIWATLKVTLADESALRAMWSMKGSGGTKPCPKCMNLVNHRAGLDLNAGELLVDSSCNDPSQFIPNNNDSLWLSAERVADPTLSNAKRKELETLLGVNHHPESILNARDLRGIARPADCIFFDVQHCVLVGGVFPFELYLFLERSRLAGLLDYPQVSQKLVSWRWPSWVTAPPTKLCNPKHAASSRESGMFKGGANDLLNFYPVFRSILAETLKDKDPELLDLQAVSMFAVFNVLDGFCALQHGRDAPNWGVAVEVWFTAFLKAYPGENPHPKHHYTLHLASQYKSERMVMTCFNLERKHTHYKMHAGATTQLQGFEKSLSMQVLNEQVRSLLDGPALKPSASLLNPFRHEGLSELVMFAGEIKGAEGRQA